MDITKDDEKFVEVIRAVEQLVGHKRFIFILPIDEELLDDGVRVASKMASGLNPHDTAIILEDAFEAASQREADYHIKANFSN